MLNLIKSKNNLPDVRFEFSRNNMNVFFNSKYIDYLSVEEREIELLKNICTMGYAPDVAWLMSGYSMFAGNYNRLKEIFESSLEDLSEYDFDFPTELPFSRGDIYNGVRWL